MTKKVAVIDGNSLMHRAYHALPATMNAPDGTPTNAVFGFLSMLLKFIDVANPDAIICAFDAGKPKFRIELSEQYKAQRPPMDDELRVQFAVVEDVLDALNIPVIKVPGWEGDDILGTIAARGEALGYQTLLVTGDKDACQLSSELTKIVTTKKGISDVEIMGPSEVYAKYGVTPKQFPDFLGLMGDSSDNIPGVAGVGAKTAAKYLQQYDSIEGLYEHVDELKGKIKQKVIDSKEIAFLSRQIATIVCDLDFELDIEACSFPSFSAKDANDVCKRYGFMSHLPHILSLVGASKSDFDDGFKVDGWQRYLVDKGAIDAIKCAIQDKKDIFVASVEPVQASLFDSQIYIGFAIDNTVCVLEGDAAKQTLATAVKSTQVIACNVKELLRNIYPQSQSDKTQISISDLMDMNVFDVALASYVLDSSLLDYSINSLVGKFFCASLEDVTDDKERASYFACVCQKLYKACKEALDKDKSQDVFRDVDMPLVACLLIMERNGANIDVKKLSKIGKSTQSDLDNLHARITELAGEDFNIDSPKQLSHILFDVIGFTPVKKTKTGYSTDAKVLTELAKEHELPRLVLQYREFAKIKSTYIDALPNMVNVADGLIHAQFNQLVTTTGRLSSSNPNLQNIPVRSEYGKHIRECFIPVNEGDVFVSADYSQIELRILAHLSGDNHLIDAFKLGQDFHANTAARVFGVDIDDVTPQMRSRAKAVNFGIVYGQQAYGLSQSLDIPFYEAQGMIDAYFEVYPKVKKYLDKIVSDAHKNGYAQTMFGRKRHIKELAAKNAATRGFGERTAMNHPMQGSAADIIKLSMRKCQEELVKNSYKTQMILQVHDELCFSVAPSELDSACAMIKDVMENVVELKVPLVVDVHQGKNWAQAH